MIKLGQKIEELIKPVIGAMGYELWGLELHGASSRHATLRIYIESSIPERVITLDDCTLVSNQVGALLDVADLIVGRYSLEVSSPGLDRLLFKIEHYQKFIGHKIRVSLFKSEGGRRNYSGQIKAVEQGKIILTTADGLIEIPFENIQKANLVSNF